MLLEDFVGKVDERFAAVAERVRREILEILLHLAPQPGQIFSALLEGFAIRLGAALPRGHLGMQLLDLQLGVAEPLLEGSKE